MPPKAGPISRRRETSRSTALDRQRLREALTRARAPRKPVADLKAMTRQPSPAAPGRYAANNGARHPEPGRRETAGSRRSRVQIPMEPGTRAASSHLKKPPRFSASSPTTPSEQGVQSMNSKISTKLGALALTLGIGILASAQSLADATIVIINLDGPNEGFNDQTPAVPVGGNNGATRGDQRLIAFQHAADSWGDTLDSNVIITVQAAFNPLGANVLGSAGSGFIVSDFPGVGLHPGAEFPNTFYGGALADKRAGEELVRAGTDINAQFSSDFNFYLGLDNNHGAQVDLRHGRAARARAWAELPDVLRQGHGRTAGGGPGSTDIYARRLFDRTFELNWPDMTNAQVAASAIKFGNLVWSGDTVNDAVPHVLIFGSPQVDVLSPDTIDGTYQFGTAAFGPAVGSPNVTASVVAAEDPVEPVAGATATDGCSAFTIPAAIAGNIALVERGTCGFAVKAKRH